MESQQVNLDKRNKFLNKAKIAATVGAGLYLLPSTLASEVTYSDKVSNKDLLRYNEELTLISILMNYVNSRMQIKER